MAHIEFWLFQGTRTSITRIPYKFVIIWGGGGGGRGNALAGNAALGLNFTEEGQVSPICIEFYAWF